MKLFPGWRNVGRAMLDARRREGVVVERVKAGRWTRYTWDQGERGVSAYVRPDRDTCKLYVDSNAGWINGATFNDTPAVLRVLAALGLVRADIAYAADERYGRCQVCGELAQWVPPTGDFAGRWCHLDPDRPYHRPEVAG